MTTGEIWRFGVFGRQQHHVIEDQTLYRVPQDLEALLRILVGILIPLHSSKAEE